MNKERKNKRKLTLKERSPDLKIYSPRGELLYIGYEGFCVDYQALLRQKEQKSKYRRLKRGF